MPIIFELSPGLEKRLKQRGIRVRELDSKGQTKIQDAYKEITKVVETAYRYCRYNMDEEKKR